MTHCFTRRQLYDLVWSEPMQSLAKKYGISDRGLAKHCTRADIPVPPRGYWAKLQAGMKVVKQPLPPRGLGMSDEVEFGSNRWSYGYLSNEEALTMTIPPPPVFDEDMTVVIERVKRMVAKAKIPKSLTQPHRLIAKLLEEDEVRRQKQLASQYEWDKPLFETPFERRRLKLLNGIFTAVERCGMKPSLRGREARELHVLVGDKSVTFYLDSMQAERQLERERSGYGFIARGERDKIQLGFSDWRYPKESHKKWQDSDQAKIEAHLQEIIEELIIAGETYYREGAIRHHAWLIERKATAEKEERKRKTEEERKRREHQAKLEKQRVDYLLGQSTALRQAGEIRAYVDAVRQANAISDNPMSPGEFEQWVEWALAQADRIDPIRSGQYRVRIHESEDAVS